MAIRVKPSARRTSVGGRHEGPHGPALVIAVSAPTVDGRATRAALEALADALRVRARDVVLVTGERSRDKLVDVPDGVRDRLTPLLGAND